VSRPYKRSLLGSIFGCAFWFGALLCLDVGGNPTITQAKQTHPSCRNLLTQLDNTIPTRKWHRSLLTKRSYPTNLPPFTHSTRTTTMHTLSRTSLIYLSHADIPEPPYPSMNYYSDTYSNEEKLTQGRYFKPTAHTRYTRSANASASH